MKALERAGYGAEPAPEHVSGYGCALRFRRQDRQHLCPVLERPPRDLEGWEPWSCDLDRDHEDPHHNLVMRYRWTDDTAGNLCGAWDSSLIAGRTFSNTPTNLIKPPRDGAGRGPLRTR